jgi:hypothetical protein
MPPRREMRWKARGFPNWTSPVKTLPGPFSGNYLGPIQPSRHELPMRRQERLMKDAARS